MMMTRSPENPSNESISDGTITTSTCPTWKLYENPFYISQQQQNHQRRSDEKRNANSQKQIHHLNLPISARKIAASFWDLTFIKPFMESELETARAQISELKTELESERKARKRVEAMSKKFARELSEERKGREALERVCEELAKELSSHKAELNKIKKDMEEERKMIRMAEVLREERVQMKLSEAKFLLEEKSLQLEATKILQIDQTSSDSTAKSIYQEGNYPQQAAGNSSGGKTRSVIAEKSTTTTTSVSSTCTVVDSSGRNHSSSMEFQRRASLEPENPHIKQGIKGFVEFPKVVRAIGYRSRHMGTKSECHRAQLSMLVKQKNPIRSNSVVSS